MMNDERGRKTIAFRFIIHHSPFIVYNPELVEL
jgi:hypothetical protein